MYFHLGGGGDEKQAINLEWPNCWSAKQPSILGSSGPWSSGSRVLGSSGALRTGSMTFEATLWQNLDQLYAK